MLFKYKKLNISIILRHRLSIFSCSFHTHRSSSTPHHQPSATETIEMASKTYDDPYRHTCLVPYVDPDTAPPEIASRIKVHSFRRNVFLTLAHSPGLFPHVMGVIGGCFQGKSRTVPLLDWVREPSSNLFFLGFFSVLLLKLLVSATHCPTCRHQSRREIHVRCESAGF